MEGLLTEADKDLFRRVWRGTGTHEAYEELYDKLLMERGREFISRHWQQAVRVLRVLETELERGQL